MVGTNSAQNAFDKVNEVGVIGIELKERKFTYFKRRFRGRRRRGIFNSLLSSQKQKTAHIYFVNTSIQKLKGPSCIGGFMFFGFQIQLVLFQKLKGLILGLQVTSPKNQTKKLSIILSFYFHQVLQYLNIFT